MMMTMLIAATLAGVVAAQTTEVTLPGPQGPLAGTLLDPGKSTPAVLILPGSGPTDRDGNNPMGVAAAPYRLLAEALAARGIATLRIDKRGLFGSKAAIADGNAVTIADYAADARGWVDLVRRTTGRSCVWLAGHSEGGLIALAAAQRRPGGSDGGLCGVILIAAPGRPLAAVMKAQFAASSQLAPVRAQADAAIDALAAGRRVDAATLPVPLSAVFNAAVQGFIIDLFRQRPAEEAAAIRLPMLIVQGEADLQVDVADARALAAANPQARLALLPGVNHVLKAVAGDRAANLATYGDASLPIAPGVIDAVAGFVTAKR